MSNKGCKILLLEDNEDLRLSLEEIMNFERPEFKIESFENGDVAWKHLEENKINYDVIILDHMVPGMKGLDICSAINHNDNLKKIPVIIQSGKMCLTNEEEAKHSGAYAYKTKPYPSDSLIKLIEEAILDSPVNINIE